MEFWFAAVLLTLAATLIVLLPLTRNRRDFLPAEINDLEVYRDQLREVDADLARGMIDAVSAEQARIEISRRILAAEKADNAIEADRHKRSGRIISLAAVLCVPLIAWGVYPLFGMPDMPAMPLASRSAPPENRSVDELIARAEEHLAQNPGDVRGWEVLAPIYLRMGRAADAANAYRSAIRLAGENLSRNLGLGEALLAASGGTVTAEAEAVFEKAANIAPDDIRPQFYLAQSEVQDGKPDFAVKRLQSYLDRTNPDQQVRSQVEQLITRILSEPKPVSGPTSDDVEAAASLAPEDRQAMIEGMVARLDERLRNEGNDLEGWKQLLRSYLIINQREAAEDALKRGVTALDADKRAQLEGFAAQLGLKTGSAKQ